MDPKPKIFYPRRNDDLKKIVKKFPVLYKYVSLETASEILSNGTIKFTKCSELNDPFEYNIGNWDTTNLHPNEKILINWIQSVNYDISGILSFSQRFDIILLWSYYSCGHKGVCIGYDTKYIVNYILNNPDLNPETFLSSIVIYPKKRILSNNLIIKEPGCENYSSLFIKLLKTKNIFWKFEKEVRFSLKSVSDKPIPIGIECIKEIYIGGSFKLNDAEKIKNFWELTKQNFKGIVMQMGYNYEKNTLLAKEYCEEKTLVNN